jgi:hypothetical protein
MRKTSQNLEATKSEAFGYVHPHYYVLKGLKAEVIVILVCLVVDIGVPVTVTKVLVFRTSDIFIEAYPSDFYHMGSKNARKDDH